MKQFVTLLIFIVVGIAIYTAYGFITFKPDEASPFVFNEPTLPPEIAAEQKAAESSSLSAEEEAQKNLAITEAQKALETYKLFETSAPQQAKDTMIIISDSIGNWALPPYFLSSPDSQLGGARKFEKLKFEMANTAIADGAQKSLGCTAKTPIASVVVGTTGGDDLGCDSVRDVMGQKAQSDILFIGGPGNDKITDATGNRVINGGTGDDVLTVGAGRTLIVLEPAWGHDTLTVDCSAASVAENQVPKGFPIPWGYKTTNFIVLSSALNPKDISWKGNVLTSAAGDTLTVSENCFTVVPLGQ